MKRPISIATVVVVLIVLSAITLSQTPESPTPEPRLPIIRLEDGSISGLGPIYSHGMGFWIAVTDKAEILAGAEDFGDTFAVAIAIRNKSIGMFTFDPSEITAIDLLTGKNLTYLSPSALAGKDAKSRNVAQVRSGIRARRGPRESGDVSPGGYRRFGHFQRAKFDWRFVWRVI